MSSLNNVIKYKYALALVLIISFGSFLRLYEIEKQSLWIDEGYTIMQEKSITAHGYPLLMSGNIEYKDSLFPYILSFLRIFTGENISIFRFTSAIFGIASIVIIYLLGKNYFNKNIGIISAFLLSTSYWHIAWSRQIRSYSLFVFLFLLSLLFYFYYSKLNDKKNLYILLSLLVLAILAKFSIGLIFSIPVLIFFLFQKKRISYKIILFSCILIFFAVSLNHSFLVRIISFFGANYIRYYMIDYFWKYFGLLFVLAIVGLYMNFNEKSKSVKSWPQLNIIIFISALLFFSFFSLINQKRYLFFLTPLIFIYSSYCLYCLTKRKTLMLYIAFIFIVLIDQFTVKSINFIPLNEYYLEEYTPQPNFNSAYQFIAKNFSDTKIISAYPFMDYIYTNKIGFALPVSYTGLLNDPALTFPTEYYTNAPRLLTTENLTSMRSGLPTLIILDDMAISRSNKNMIIYIQENGELVFQNENQKGQKIIIFKLQ